MKKILKKKPVFYNGQKFRIDGFKRKQRVKKFLKIMLTGTLIIGVGFLLFFISAQFFNILIQHEYLKVKEIKVTGNNNLSNGEILKLSGLTEKNDSIFLVSLSEVKGKIKLSPWIETAEIKREMPNGISIRVKERTPKAVIKLENFYLVDGEGIIFAKAEVSDIIKYPIITGIKSNSKNVVEAYWIPLIKEAMVVKESVGSSFINDNLSEIKISASEGFTIYTTKEPIEVKLGFGGYAEKLNKVSKVIEDLKKKNLQVKQLDASFEGKVIFKKG